MTNSMTVSEVARMIEAESGIAVAPRLISDLLYQRNLPERLTPMIGGRRLINPEALPLIKDMVLKRYQQSEKPAPDGH